MGSNSAYAAYSKSKEFRLYSSSGSIFSELACIVLDQGGVVFGAVYTNGYSIKQVGVTTKSDLSILRGAKYVKSKFGDSYN